MKNYTAEKKISVLLLAVSVAAGLLTGCGDDHTAESPAPVSQSETPAEATLAPVPLPAPTGQVYYLTSTAESAAEQAWQDLAETYTEQTGIPVYIVPVDPEQYSDTLAAELHKQNAPVLFDCTDQDMFARFQNDCLPLNDAEVLQEMYVTPFSFKGTGDDLLALGYCYETLGVVVNRALLEQAGHTLEEIQDFPSLKTIAGDIHSNAETLGFDACSAPEADRDQAEREFGEGKTVFYQSGSWEYPRLTKQLGMKGTDLALLPLFWGADGAETVGLCCGATRFWSVNRNASEEDRKATLDFLKWLAVSDEGAKMLTEQFGVTPFRNTAEPTNPFLAQASQYLAQGGIMVDHSLDWPPAWALETIHF